MLRKIRTSNDELNRVQDNTARAYDSLTQSAIGQGLLLTSITLSSGSNSVPHSLGRVPNGYIIVSRSANAEVWDAPSSAPTAFLALSASAPVTISLWVF